MLAGGGGVFQRTPCHKLTSTVSLLRTAAHAREGLGLPTTQAAPVKDTWQAKGSLCEQAKAPLPLTASRV